MHGIEGAALALVLLGLAGAAGGCNGPGSFCTSRSECSAGLTCVMPGQGRGVCTYPSTTADAAPRDGARDGRAVDRAIDRPRDRAADRASDRALSDSAMQDRSADRELLDKAAAN